MSGGTVFVRNPEPFDDVSYAQDEDGSALLICPIGSDHSIEATLFIQVAVQWDKDFDAFEFFFAISVEFADSEYPDRCLSGHDTKKYITEAEDREYVLTSALTAMTMLLRQARPDRVIIFSNDPDLPPAALGKYVKITAVFERCGYRVVELPSNLRRRVWRAERTS